MAEIVGKTIVSNKNTITIPKSVAEDLKLKQGDFIIFYKDEKGRIIIKKAKLVEE